MTGQIEMVDRFDIMIPDPSSRTRYPAAVPMARETILHVLHHEPLAVADRIKVPVKAFGVRDDTLVPYDQTAQFLENVPTEKELVVIEHGNHWAVYDVALPVVAAETIAWFKRFLLHDGNSKGQAD